MDSNIDRIAKDILFNSQLELSDPLFNSAVMSAVAIEAHRKVKRRIVLILLFIIAILVSAGYLVIRIFHIHPGQLLQSPGKVGAFYGGISKILETIAENEYLILPLVLILITKKIIDFKVKYSK